MQISPTGLCAYSRSSRLLWLTLPLLFLCVAIVSDTAQAPGTIHPETRRPRGRAFKAKPDIAATAEPVCCQRFFVCGPASSFFSVIPPSPIRQQRLAGTMSPEAGFIQAQVNRDMQERLTHEEEQEQQITSQNHSTEVPPWLDLTQWPKYLIAFLE